MKNFYKFYKRILKIRTKYMLKNIIIINLKILSFILIILFLDYFISIKNIF